jgi:CheY-like chemotaxis protein
VNYTDLNFLVVDDDDAILEIVAAGIATFGATKITKCPDGVVATQALSNPSQKFHCVISDYNMTPITGLNLLAGIRTGRYAHLPRDLPFIILTTSDEDDVLKAALQLDVSAYVLKPVPRESLASALKRANSRKLELKSVQDYTAISIPAQ